MINWHLVNCSLGTTQISAEQNKHIATEKRASNCELYWEQNGVLKHISGVNLCSVRGKMLKENLVKSCPRAPAAACAPAPTLMGSSLCFVSNWWSEEQKHAHTQKSNLRQVFKLIDWSNWCITPMNFLVNLYGPLTARVYMWMRLQVKPCNILVLVMKTLLQSYM